jgi:arginine/ornithine N-succinyltransferase beta subunit
MGDERKPCTLVMLSGARFPLFVHETYEEARDRIGKAHAAGGMAELTLLDGTPVTVRGRAVDYCHAGTVAHPGPA